VVFVIGILIFFALIFVLVKAFAKEKPDKIISKDMSGNETIQYIEKGKSASKTAAQIIVGIIISIFIITFLFLCSVL
jgi:heme/copper-type cytochrome/quinol oxidase subunit 2